MGDGISSLKCKEANKIVIVCHWSSHCLLILNCVPVLIHCHKNAELPRKMTAKVNSWCGFK